MEKTTMLKEYEWSRIYRPRTVADTILPPDLKAMFQGFVDQGFVPNITLAGPPGIGKTTVAKAMLEQLGCDVMVISASLDRGIDMLRNDIMQYASTVSFAGGRKYVILDEADYLPAHSTQPALRNFINEFSDNCGFILTCNYKDKLIDPLISRCPVIEFKVTKETKLKLFSQFLKRVEFILKENNVQYKQEVLIEVIKKYFPDMRECLNVLQQYAAATGNNIDTGILANMAEVSLKALIEHMAKKDFTNVRKWVAEHADADQARLFRSFYDNASKYFAPSSIPVLVLILGKYMYQASFVADPEVNIAACMAEIMIECSFNG
jgi:DNA polymerase III delta prime subunit